MFKEPLHKRFLFSLRFSILTIFITLFVISISTLIIIAYSRFLTNTSYTALNLMEDASGSVLHELINNLNDTEMASQFSSENIQRGILNSNNLNDLTNYTFNLIHSTSKEIPNLYQAAWGDEQGNSVEAEKEPDGTIMNDNVDRTQVPPIHLLIYRDLSGNIIKKTASKSVIYDPRMRPWYKTAKHEKKLIWTDVYPSEHTQLLGISAAIPVFRDNGELQGVFKLKIRLDYLEHYIESIKTTKNGTIYIVTDKGKVISFPKIAQSHQAELINIDKLTSYPWIIKSFQLYKKTGDRQFRFRYGHTNYLAVYNRIPHFAAHGWMIGIVIPEDDFIGALRKNKFHRYSNQLYYFDTWYFNRIEFDNARY